MKILLLIYFISTIVLSITRISLLKGKRLQWLAILTPGLICLCFYSFSLRQNNQTLNWLLKQENLVSGIAITLTFEAIIIILLTVIQIKSYYNIKWPRLWKWVSAIPSFQLIISLVFLQTYLFLKVSGYSFTLLAAAFFLVSTLVLGILTFSFQTILKKWSVRAELQTLIAMFQLLLAMFLPLIAKGQRVNFTQITIDYSSILFTIALVVFITAIGYFLYKQKNNNNKL